MTWVHCTDLCLQNSWLVKHSWERNRESWLCLHEQVNSGCCWGRRPGLWPLSHYPLLPTTVWVLGNQSYLLHQHTLHPCFVPAQPSPSFCHTPPRLFWVVSTTLWSPSCCDQLSCHHSGTGWEKATPHREPVAFSDHLGWLLQKWPLCCGAALSTAWH